MYSLRAAKVPTNFFPNSLALRILRIGKSIAFLRSCCNQDIPVSNIIGQTQCEENISSATIPFLEKLVDFGEYKYNKRAVSVMLKEFFIKENFEAAKKFLFFEQGDFALALLTEISEELNQPAEKIFIHRLRSHLESALLSNGRCQPQQILRRVRVTFDRKGTGWDSFGLTFYAEPPMNMIFTPEVVSEYEKISSFLWQLKRVEFALIRNRQNHPLKSLHLKALYKFHVIHNHMLRFINDLQFFLMNDSINSAWKLFMQKLKHASNLDQIHEAHSDYLQRILRQCLFSVELEPVMAVIMKICKTALDFRTFQNSLYLETNSFQLSVKSGLEPSLESFEVTKRNNYRRCVKVIEQYQSYLSKLAELIKRHKLVHLLSFAKYSQFNL